MTSASPPPTTIDRLQEVLTDVLMRTVGLDEIDQFLLLNQMLRDASNAGDDLLVEAIKDWLPPMLAELRVRGCGQMGNA